MSDLDKINSIFNASNEIAVDAFITQKIDFVDIYKVIITVEAVSVTDANLRLVNSAGSIVTSSQQDTAIQVLRANSSFSELKTENDDKLHRFGGLYDTTGGSFVYYIFNPTNTSLFTSLIAQGQATDGGNGRGFKQIGILTETTSITGLNFVFNDDNVDVGKIRTYGLRVDT